MSFINYKIFYVIYSGKSVCYSSYFEVGFVTGFVRTSSKGTDCIVRECSAAGTKVTFLRPVYIPPCEMKYLSLG